MAKERVRDSWVTVTLKYPGGEICPQDFLRFIEPGTFGEDWARLGLDDEDLMMLQVLIMADPKGDEPIPETRGFRMMRFKSPKAHKDRHNGVLVGYVYFEESSVAALLVVADLNEPLGMTPEMCSSIGELIAFVEEGLAKGD